MRYEKEGGDPANAGVVAIKSMGGPDIPWKAGRSDFDDDSLLPPRGRLPDGSQAQDHLRHIFYRMGFNDQEIVALSGAHNLGRCHADRSVSKVHGLTIQLDSVINTTNYS
ncbi:hypothetical protein L7F22_016568 [Adiantum nelumboides]|nr:hypothetical protein [Adiantum nelumboides]